MIKKVILELWCMSYGAGLFLLETWRFWVVIALVWALACKIASNKNRRPA